MAQAHDPRSIGETAPEQPCSRFHYQDVSERDPAGGMITHRGAAKAAEAETVAMTKAELIWTIVNRN